MRWLLISKGFRRSTPKDAMRRNLAASSPWSANMSGTNSRIDHASYLIQIIYKTLDSAILCRIIDVDNQDKFWLAFLLLW
jgi:hypothetical protein